MKRGRPKGRSRDNRSFGPLGDLIRQYRLEKRLGLLDVAKACRCSVQFISNIEHGRAPLPWEKVGMLAEYLGIAVEQVQAANLSVRSDFRTFVTSTKGRSKKIQTPHVLHGVTGAASALAATARDHLLRQVIERYQVASPALRRKFVKTAMQLFQKELN